MGFGWLFIGYIISYLMSFTPYSAGLVFMGCLIMQHGIGRLRSFNSTFNMASYSLMGLIAVRLYMFANFADDILSLGLAIFDGPVLLVFNILDPIAEIAFHVTLMIAIRSITHDLDLPRQNNAAARNLAMSIICYAVALVWLIPMPETVKAGLTMFWVIARLLTAVLNIILIYSCYMYICPVGDEDMPLKKSRFGFINRFREETARREQKAADENVKMFTDLRDKRRKKKSQKHKKK